MYADGDYDLAGTIVGVVDRPKLPRRLPRRRRDVLLGLPSSGLHTNGYSLARMLFFERLGLGPHDLVPELGSTVAEALLAIHRSYLAPLQPLVEDGLLSAMSHVTGGGFPDNLPAGPPGGPPRPSSRPEAGNGPLCSASSRTKERASGRDAPCLQLRHRMVLFVAASNVPEVTRRLAAAGERVLPVGRVERGLAAFVSRDAVTGVASVAPAPWFPLPARLAVLLSGRGSNFEALADACERRELAATVVLVLSDRADAPGLGKARSRGLPAVVEERLAGEARAAHEERLAMRIEAAAADLVCLAGFMRVLSPAFVARFERRIVNVHPSLLPAFPGLDAQKQALEHGVKVAGATVHLVDAGTDTGPIAGRNRCRSSPETT